MRPPNVLGLFFGLQVASWALRDSIFVLEAKVEINQDAEGKLIMFLTSAVAIGMLYDVEISVDGNGQHFSSRLQGRVLDTRRVQASNSDLYKEDFR